MPIERVFHHYTAWEDWQAGLYRPAVPTQAAIAEAAAVLVDPMRCREAMDRVVALWPRAAEQNLTDPTCNRRAWLGRSAMCIATGHPEDVGRPAWWTLTEAQMIEANAIADEVIRTWEANYTDPCQSDFWGRAS